jgi:3-methylcrotonyl-CoA carboxylase alpha subunit
VSDTTRTEVTVHALGQARFVVDSGVGRRLAHAVHADGRTWVWCDGHQYVVADEGPGAQVRTDDVELQAPMPARVRSVAASHGQEVRAGQVLLVLEAMKMELSIRAPRDGVIRAIRCAVGDLVQPGAPLVEFEP